MFRTDGARGAEVITTNSSDLLPFLTSATAVPLIAVRQGGLPALKTICRSGIGGRDSWVGTRVRSSHVTSLSEPEWRRSSRCESGSCVEAALDGKGAVLVRDSKTPEGPVLRFTAASWSTFTDAIRKDRFTS
ncbi:DUF397 domain-containing protein [Virgisporangium ochraceum]|uniref:DUF397 domain-containing protein n=1 Tax=Virgisporangium ochraceum TaxID=65505 RepID=UPI0019409188|nr:DUF397 domain-containing protein [Virgisporangium ochraceum]